MAQVEDWPLAPHDAQLEEPEAMAKELAGQQVQVDKPTVAAMVPGSQDLQKVVLKEYLPALQALQVDSPVVLAM